MKTLEHIKVYEDEKEIQGRPQKISVVEISPGFDRISHLLGVYDEVLRLNNPILLTGKKIMLQNIEPLLQICCEHVTMVDVSQNRFSENLDLVVDLFIINVDLDNVDEAVLGKYIKIWNGKNLFFNFKGKDSGKELVKRLGLEEKGIPFKVVE